VVEVAGAVRRPGVYRLPPGSRTGEAIAAAGGFGPKVDLELADRRLNLAQPLRDGEEIRVPAIGEPDDAAAGLAPAARNPAAPASATAGLVDVNAATAEQLDTLPGIGPATAAKIVAAREQQRFASLDEMVARKVIGAALLTRIQPLATAAP
jgi:competence protein ComEA